jgi:hypothetical protein
VYAHIAACKIDMDSQEAWLYELLDKTPPAHTPEPKLVSFWDHAASAGDSLESTPSKSNDSPESEPCELNLCDSAISTSVEPCSPAKGVPTAALDFSSPAEKLPTVDLTQSDAKDIDASTPSCPAGAEGRPVNLFVGQTWDGALKIIRDNGIPDCIFHRTKRGYRVTAGLGLSI